jgi:hypothetical protein
MATTTAQRDSMKQYDKHGLPINLEWLSPRVVATTLSVSLPTIQSMVERGDLVGTKAERQMQINKASVVKMLERGVSNAE